MKKLLALILAAIMLASCCLFTACSKENTEAPADTDADTNAEKPVFTVAMECAYAPYNWSQPDDSNGAVPIKGSASFANGYDIMIAKKICEANGWDLEVLQLDWDSLIPAVQTGQCDAVIAGQSMTEDRMKEVDFAGPYLYATIVCLTKADSKFADAKSIDDLAGGKCTSQMSTIWYDSCLPQIKDAEILPGKEGAPAMLMALETGEVDFVCTDMPTAQAALIAYPDMVLLDFDEEDGDFEVDEGDINIGISVKKGNTEVLDACNKALEGMTEDDFNAIMNNAIKIQPVSED